MNTARKEGELAVLPSAYQRTHALAMAAHKGAAELSTHVLQLVDRVASTEKDQVELWKKIQLATTRHDAIEAVHEHYRQQLQFLRIVALTSCGAGLLSVVLNIASMIAG